MYAQPKKIVTLLAVLSTIPLLLIISLQQLIVKPIIPCQKNALLFKPSGASASSIDRLMLLNMWAHHVDDQMKKSGKKATMLFAGIGKPTYMLNNDLTCAAADYWQKYVQANKALKQSLSKITTTADSIDSMATHSTAIDYGDIAGELIYRSTMAQALTNWYKVSISENDLIFAVGGAGALTLLFKMINEKHLNGKIITFAPYYPFYNNEAHANNLHLIDLMKEPGYRLTADVLQKGIDDAQKSARKEGTPISGFLFCDPCNPLGSMIGHEEWKKIALVLKNIPHDIPIILDEAYAEIVCGDQQHTSLLTIAPELKDRIIIVRSTTKGFSASGERMAVVICNNPSWREEIITNTVFAYLHMPKSLQHAYSQAMLNFTPEKRKQLSNHYAQQVEYADKRLKEMNIQLPDPAYRVEATFYILADLSCLFGSEMPREAEKVFGRTGSITTDEELCYSLLLEDHLMVAPLSYFGADPKLGYVRITCTEGIRKLSELFDRIENKIKQCKTT